MKFLIILLTTFSINACGNSTATTTMQNKNPNVMSGTYIITALGNDTNLPNDLSLEFDTESNQVSGFSGCNRFFGSYKLESNSIIFGNLASTKMMCQEEANKIEFKIMNALSQVNKFMLENNVLTLLNESNQLILAKQKISFIIEYMAHSRGTYMNLKISERVISIEKDRNSKPIT